MNYKQYTAVVKFDEEAEIFFGEVINTKDVITFEGKTTQELKQAFHDSVDDYLDFCKSLGQSPSKSFSGKFMIRIKPQKHQRIFEQARKNGLSINKFIEQKLDQCVV